MYGKQFKYSLNCGENLKIFERAKIATISLLGYWVMRLIGSTLRWEVINWQNLQKVYETGKRPILAFWHGRIFLATYYFRGRGIVVLTSQNRDGEYIARVIRRFGYGAARGSSTRGSHRATVEALRALAEGRDVGLAMDGPRGPRYQAKRGAAFIARKSGNPVLPFCLAAKKKWVVKSWDHFQIPKPFSRAVVIIGEAINVDERSGEEDIRIIEARIQNSMDELRDRADNWWNAGVSSQIKFKA